MMSTRRSFLQTITGPLAALPLMAHLPVQTNNSDKVLRVAFMGLGSYANRVANAIKESGRVKVAGVISGTPAKISDWQQRFSIPAKNCYSYDNYDRIRDNPDIDVVYILTPNALHHEATLRVAKAGKHVICEKPMAVNAGEAREMVDACAAAGVQLLIGYRMHFEAKTLELIRQRDAGEFGKILFFQGLSGFRIGDPSQWRLKKSLAGGGALMDIGIYSVNGSRYMVGEDPVWVTAQETKTDPVKFAEGVDETITFQLGFPGGAIASCLSTYSMGYLDRFFLDGEKGFAELQPASGYGPIMGRTHRGEIIAPHITHQLVQMEEMAEIILGGRKPRVAVDGVEGLKDMIILDAIYAAARSGQKVPVRLP